MAIETNELIDVQTLPPFKKFIMTIGNIPTSYLESMSYAELLMWFCNYLQETVIPTVNNNGEAVEELQALFVELKGYVDDYFENLDVQTEINNKLDQMAQDGSLSVLIENYLNPYIIAQNNEIAMFKGEVNSTISQFNNKLNNLISGAPAGTYDTVEDLQTDDPDHDKVYLVSADGKWYYYDEGLETWVAGGTYQATQISEDDPIIIDLEDQIKSFTDTSTYTYSNTGTTAVQSGLTWGFRIERKAAMLEMTPSFNNNDGTYTVNRYHCNDIVTSEATYELVDTIANINKTDSFKLYDLTQNDFVTITPSTGKCYYGNYSASSYHGNAVYINNSVLAVTNNAYLSGSYTEIINNINSNNLELKHYNKIIGGIHSTHQLVSNTGELSYTSSDSNYRTNKYSVSPSTQYKIHTWAKGSSACVVAFFNGTSFINYNTAIDTTLTEYNLTVTTPNNCNIMIVNCYYPNVAVVKEIGDNDDSVYKGELFETIGDSRTWYDQQTFGANTLDIGDVCNGYQYYMRNKLGITTFNEGRSGWTTTQLATLFINNSYSFLTSGFKNIILAGGVNDWLHNVEIGELKPIGSSFNINTVYGALQTIIEQLQTNDDIRIFMLTPFTGWSNGIEYNQSYTDARIEVAKLYNIPILDLTNNSRLNVLNKDNYYVDDTTVTYQLHLNNDGYKYIENEICKFINNN